MDIVFTRQDNLEHDGLSLEKHLQDSSPVLQEQVKQCQGRYIAVNNRAGDEVKFQFRHDLIKLIDGTVEGNYGNCYTNDMFDVAESIMKREEQNILAEIEGEISLERDVQSDLLLKEREELERKAEEERRRQEEEMAMVIMEMDQMVQELRQSEEDKVRMMKADQDRRMRDFQEQYDEQVQREKELKARLETEIDENRYIYERELQAAQEKSEELRLLRERDIEAARMGSERLVKEEKRRMHLFKKEKEEEMRRLEEKAKVQRRGPTVNV